MCIECFYNIKRTREDVLTVGTLKKNLLIKATVFVEKYTKIFAFLKNNKKDHFNMILKDNFGKFNRQLNQYFEQTKFSRNVYDSLYQEFMKLFSILYFLFKKFNTMYDAYWANYSKLEKLMFYRDNANSKRITSAIIREITATLWQLERVEFIAFLEKSREILSLLAVKEIILKRFDDEFIDWALPIIAVKTIDENGRINQTKLRQDFSLATALFAEATPPVGVAYSYLPGSKSKMAFKLAFQADLGVQSLEFDFDSSETVSLLKNNKWCQIF